MTTPRQQRRLSYLAGSIAPDDRANACNTVLSVLRQHPTGGLSKTALKHITELPLAEVKLAVAELLERGAIRAEEYDKPEWANRVTKYWAVSK